MGASLRPSEAWPHERLPATQEQSVTLHRLHNTDPLSLGRFCFEYTDVPDHQIVGSNRVYSGYKESRCLKKCSPFAFATLSTTGDCKHVEVAHQVAFQLWICMGDERRKDEFNDQQTAILRNYRVAVLENSNGIPVLTPVQIHV